MLLWTSNAIDDSAVYRPGSLRHGGVNWHIDITINLIHIHLPMKATNTMQ